MASSSSSNSRCLVYNRALLDDLVQDGREKTRKEKAAKRTEMRNNSKLAQYQHHLDGASTMSHLSLEERAYRSHRKAMENPADARKSKIMSSHASLHEEEDKQKIKYRQEYIERLKRLRIRKHGEFKKNWEGLMSGPGRELHDEWGRRLKLIDNEKELKRRQLYAEWKDKVYDPIDTAVKETAQRMHESGIARVRRREYKNFLETTNKKGGLFLDCVDEAEYDPGVLNRLSIRVAAPSHDPTKRILQKRVEEMGMVPGKAVETVKDGTRDTIPPPMWATGKIEATPHGHFAKMHDADQRGSHVPDTAATKVTLKTGYFDHFKMPRDLKLMNDEWNARYGKGKASGDIRPTDQLKLG